MNETPTTKGLIAVVAVAALAIIAIMCAYNIFVLHGNGASYAFLLTVVGILASLAGVVGGIKIRMVGEVMEALDKWQSRQQR